MRRSARSGEACPLPGSIATGGELRPGPSTRIAADRSAECYTSLGGKRRKTKNKRVPGSTADAALPAAARSSCDRATHSAASSAVAKLPSPGSRP
eukprot:scaffold103810_cov63-Phaeocystis_antarctica.AAC.6